MQSSVPRRTSILLAAACASAIAVATLPIEAFRARGEGASFQGRGAGAGAATGTVDQGRGRASLPPAPLVTTGVIVGRVTDAATGEPVAGAIVMLNGGPPRSAPTQPPAAGRAATAPPPVPPRVLTDSQGRFAFRQLTRGTYSLSAEKQGYSGGAYGRTRPGGPSRPLQLDDNERMPDIVLRIYKYTSIAGRVVDDMGEPIVNVTVRAFRSMWISGRRALAPANQAQTDDRGLYRIHNLMAGEYVVSVPTASTTSSGSMTSADARQNFSMTQQNIAIPAPLMGGGMPVPGDNRFFWQPGGFGSVTPGPDGRWRTYATQYFPMARELAQAERMVLASDEERNGVDFAMAYVPANTITGIIVGSSKPPSNWVLRLVPTAAAEFSDELETAVAVSDGSGAFMFAGIPSGSYIIQTVRQPPPAPPVPPPPPPPVAGGRGVTPPVPPTGPALPLPQMTTEPLLWGITPVVVGESDLAGVGVTVREGLTISGRLEFSGSRARPDAARMAQIPVVIEAASGRDRYGFGPAARTLQDGRFTSTPKLPGRYFIRVGGAPSGWVVQSIQANGADATERPIELTTQSISNVVITFTDLIGNVRGTVRGTDPNAELPAVLMFPADPAGWREFGINPSRLKQTRAQQNGEFTFAGLSPGEYLVVGIKEEFVSDWQNPAYLEALARVAHRVSLSAGEQATLDLTVQDVKPPGIGRRPAPSPQHEDAEETALMPMENDGGPVVAGGPQPAGTLQTSQLPVRDARTPDPVGTGSIAGTITDGEQKRPLRLARVSVRGGDLLGERMAMTDADGRYVIRGLPAGNYQVSVSKPAYIAMQYGARLVAPTAGATVKLGAGAALTNIDVALSRGGVITGVILDANGLPIPFVTVQVLSYVQRDGERYLQSSGNTAQTDDRGVYRVYALRPGKYYVMARPQSNASGTDLRAQSDDEIRMAIAEASKGPVAPASTTTPRVFAPAPPDTPPTPIPAGGRPVAISPVMYPGVVREQDAMELSLNAGQELGGINFRLDYVPASRVSGVVMGPDGQPARNVRMTLFRTVGGLQTNVAVRTTPDGVFDAQGVPPGSYKLMAQVPIANPPASSDPREPRREIMHFALVDLDLFGTDAVNLRLNAVPPLTISGKIVVAGPPGEGNLRQVRVNVEPVGRPGGIVTPAVSATADATGAFTVFNVMPGRYRLAGSAPSVVTNGVPVPGFTLVGSSVGGRDSLLSPFEVTDRPITDAVVTVSAGAAEITGKLIDGKGEPVPDLFVVLFPTEPALWSTGGTRALRSGVRSLPDGTFRFNSVLPREYFLAVLTEVDPLEWGTHAYMEQLAQSAIKVQVGIGEKKVQDIKLSGR